MKLRHFTFALFLVFCTIANAQLEASIWYFGDEAGLDFRSGTPVALTDGALSTREGCATISDAMGNLLFYTNGFTVWDRNHNIMPNGNFLGGDDSSTQSAIIVPNPGNPNIFYIFTTPAIFIIGDPGLRYSEVDMTLNGGLGDINATKNVLIHAPVPEKVTAIEHANGNDIWVVTHHWGNDAFAAYLVTAAGLNTTPVISNTGFDMDYPTVGSEISFAMGAIKISPDGTKLAIAHNMVGVELFDFDAATGQVSNPVRLREDDQEYYGVEFSPNSEVLYISISEGGLLQYDLNAANIPASEVEISDSPLIFGLQLGIDGKMYIALDFVPYLAAVNQPNVVGAGCDFELQAVNLDTGISFFGLPPFIQSYFFVDEVQAENLCYGDVTEFSINVSEPVISINWNFGDGTTSTLESPTHTYLAPGTYTVTVTLTTASGTETKISEITIFDVPMANTIGDILGCTSYGSYNLDLPSFNPTILGAQDPADVIVNYFLSQQDADDNTNPLAQVHSFDYGTTPVFVRVSNVTNSLCYSTTQFNVIARQAPIVDPITDWSVCDDDLDGEFTFDLATKNTEIFNGQDTGTFEIIYFASQTDADAGTNPLPTNYTNTASIEEIFFRFQNSTYPTCFRTGSFMIEVLAGVTANTPTNLEICDDNNDGQAVFDLTQAEAEIIGTQNPASLVISYHGSQSDADTNANALPTNYTSTSYQTTIYIRAANTADESCYDTSSLQLNIFDTPVVPTVTDWQVCDDDNDGQFNFNLTEKNTEIFGAETNLVISYYELQADAELEQNPITGTFVNSTSPQTIYYRLANANSTTCYAVGNFQLQVFDTPVANSPQAIVVCDVNETGLYEFDLSMQDDSVRNGQDPNFYEVSYHATELDAMNNDNPLSKTTYQNTLLDETIYVRIQHVSLDSCYDTTSFPLLINSLPQPTLEDRYVICPDSPDLVIDAGVFESYQWEDAAGNSVGNEQTFAVLDLGEYALTVTETVNGLACSNTRNFEVVSSGAPDSFTVNTSGFSDVIRLEVEALGIGEFEYSIDGSLYQSSNSFEVFPGEYTVYVRDIFECRTLSETIFLMGYQKFFTPNGDGENENWNVIGAERLLNATVTIYDRYGKLIKRIPANDLGWDGYYNGNPVPEADYWFKFDTGEGQQMTGHFALKR
ncbi:T9SS type B sorting domain-containing protein [uncultured Croceitalea sp.]|uniref:T9SS type B sorting domain-containing protein n=1 Tax=uncultured Croceitalea sp. TaxID=1798908 RepID=UPI003305CD49